MKKTNNKGFSLVELIIVVAIMAVLVGVLAPQYIKYLDKSKVSADKQVADALYQALTTTYMDPEYYEATDVPTETAYGAFKSPATDYDAQGAYWKEVGAIMGYSKFEDLLKEFKLDVKSVQIKLDDKVFEVYVEYDTADADYSFYIE